MTETIARNPLAVALRYGALSILAFAVVCPLAWLALASLRPQAEIFQPVSEFGWRTFVPSRLTLDNYRALMSGDFPLALRNSSIVAVTTVVFGLVVNALAGFAFAAFDFRGKNLLFLLVIVSFMMPFEAIVMPLYVLISGLGWTNSYKALIIPEVANGMIIFLFRQFFASIPKDFYEAARVDGASWLYIWAFIAMPLSWPTIATSSLMLFLSQWDSFFWPVVAASDPDYAVVQVAIARNINFEQNDWGGLFASTNLAILIGMIPFLLMQRFYVRSLISGGIK
ncbi:carbohydrate ABC transporter permease [Aliirhizobium smilacinae]|uniref:sn-glycerol-3-phosphate transport system permease protein UgpE n=1 Tax=Aliirhizobium smilacinae TaxID=1395944 RepID=A0A5C4XB05_9HYPH|nr:carbohydrate ABC transporter permease [Rhizobium smilacinae]TNM59584.1 carbohydrate ABC transporter permease [Rhizobium smilacinae]